jgi:hypothetical protein
LNQDCGFYSPARYDLRTLFEGCIEELGKSSLCILYLPGTHDARPESIYNRAEGVKIDSQKKNRKASR